MGGNLQRYQKHLIFLSCLIELLVMPLGWTIILIVSSLSMNRLSNYPPFNLVQVNNVESRLEIALDGFKKEEVKVFTEFGKLFIEGKKRRRISTNLYPSCIAQRSFIRKLDSLG